MPWQSKATATLMLLRWPNLLITVLVQAIYHHRAILPALESQQINAVLNWQLRALLFGCTAIITAGGYVINDFYDQQIDQINRPERRIVGVSIPEELASWIYLVLLIVGFALAILPAIQLDEKLFLWLFPVAAAILWFYALKIKKMPLAGNVLVSSFCSLVIGIIWFSERSALRQIEVLDAELFRYLSTFSALYMALAFSTTLFREIIKDAEDLPGDLAQGAKTFPIVAGLMATKTLAAIIGILSAFLLVIVGWYLWPVFNTLLFISIAAAIFLPGLAAGYYLYRAQTPRDFGKLSNIAKWIMLVGLLLPIALKIS
jgi:4-hydroxybenzoate polyprenyltransferase